MKYFADKTTGKFLGGFEGLEPDNAFEVPMPDVGGAYWVDGAWDYTEPLSVIVRQDRDELLKASDLEVLPDRWAAMSEVKRQALATYRQALRDIPAQPGFPHEVEWPEKP